MNYLFLLIPFLALVALNLFSRKRMGEIAYWTCLVVFGLQSISAVSAIFGYVGISGQELNKLLNFNLYFDPLSLILIAITGLIACTSLIVGHNTIKTEHERFNFKNLFLVSVLGINGLAMTRDLFSLYVFVEVTAIATFILIALYKDRDAFEGVLKYLILSVVASVLMLTGIAVFLLAVGSVTFPALRLAMTTSNGNNLLSIATLLFISGLFIKGGLVPFHGWVADSYTAAPAAVTVFLAGIVTKAAGLFTLMRFLTSVSGFSSPIRDILLLVGTLSIIVGALLALGQNDMKRMLAYSSISQMGYIVVALGSGTKVGLIAALFHFFNHAIFKSQLFVNTAAIEAEVGSREMEKMGGLAVKMPYTAVTSIIGSLSTAGLPPLSGFWSKILIVMALWLAGYFTYAAIAVMASILTLAYFLRWQRSVFFGRLNESLTNVKEAKFGLVAPAVFLAGLSVVVGLLFPFFLKVVVR